MIPVSGLCQNFSECDLSEPCCMPLWQHFVSVNCYLLYEYNAKRTVGHIKTYLLSYVKNQIGDIIVYLTFICRSTICSIRIPSYRSSSTARRHWSLALRRASTDEMWSWLASCRVLTGWHSSCRMRKTHWWVRLTRISGWPRSCVYWPWIALCASGCRPYTVYFYCYCFIVSSSVSC